MSEEKEQQQERQQSSLPATTFAQLGLDDRLVRGLARQGITQPTLIQEKAIPLVLQGKDILAKAKTGSGKTLAFLLPILERVMASGGGAGAGGESLSSRPVGLVLVPTKDLASQICTVAQSLLLYMPKGTEIVNLATEDSFRHQQALLQTLPAVIVSTPSRLIPHLQGATSRLLLEGLSILAIDEADLVLGFGYGADLDRLIPHLPRNLQTILMSATINADVEQLKQLLLRSPAILRLEEGGGGGDDDPMDDLFDANSSRLKQYVIEVPGSEEKFLLCYVVLKLRLLKGKMLIFVNEVERAYRLKLFLEQFGIRTAVLNAELPLLSRHHIVEEYNRGIHDILIASDGALHYENVPKTLSAKESASVNGGEGEGEDKKKKGRSKKQRKVDAEFGVSRGVDFKRVDVVLNFDLGPTPASYIHRAGRTARNGQVGTVVSLISENEDWLVLGQLNRERRQRWYEMHGRPMKNTETLPEEEEEGEGEEAADCDKWIIPPFTFDFAQIDSFRYRTQDALRAVTKSAIHDARMKDLRRELLNSERLREHLSARPLDIQAITGGKANAVTTTTTHGANLMPQSKIKSHLKHVPSYLLQSKRSLSVANASTDESVEATGDDASMIGSLPQHPPNPSIRSGKKIHSRPPRGFGKRGGSDPLKSFKSRK